MAGSLCESSRDTRDAMACMDTLGKKLEDDVVMGSERSFGFVFAALFALIAVYPLWHGEPVRLWAALVSCALLVISLTMPAVLKPLNTLWFKFGLLLGRVMTPVAMGLIYVATVVPTGLAMRALGKDILSLAIDKRAKSYWITRDPQTRSARSMRRQF